MGRVTFVKAKEDKLWDMVGRIVGGDDFFLGKRVRVVWKKGLYALVRCEI